MGNGHEDEVSSRKLWRNLVIIDTSRLRFAEIKVGVYVFKDNTGGQLAGTVSLPLQTPHSDTNYS
jgi:hypothetical protein